MTPENHPKNTQPTPESPAEKITGVVKLKPRLDRPSPYGVQWRVNGRRTKEMFAKEKDRDARYDRLVKLQSKGVLVNEPTREEKAAWRAFTAAIGNTPWQDVVAGWRAHLAGSGRTTCTKKISEAGPEYLALMLQRTKETPPSLSYDHFRHKRRVITSYSESFGANTLDAVSGPEIENWIDDLGWQSPYTFNSYVKIISAFYRHYETLIARNPCDEIEYRDTDSDRKKHISVEETRTLFEYTQKHHPEALGRLAFEAFAGLRFSSAFRLEKSEINFEDKGVLLPRLKLKTEIQKGRRRYIDGLPENLWAWVKETNDACWAMESSQWMHLKSRLFVDAKVPHPKNCLRHSFCTYHVAAFKNPGLTATILCHRDQRKLWDTYNGNATIAEGKAYFEILPTKS